jgi:hypothetical protein
MLILSIPILKEFYTMTKTITKITLEYRTDLINHKRAPYTIDGVHYMNGGELAEALDKDRLGYKAIKDPNIKWCDGSDINDLKISCKSYRFSLTSERLGNDYETVKNEYFNRVHSILWHYIIIDNGYLIVYEMNKKEFETYLDKFHIFENGIIRGIRNKKDINNMLQWFESLIE